MDTVYKYDAMLFSGASDSDHVTIEMPENAEILHLAVQDGCVYMWARVDSDAPKEKRVFRWAGTGHDLGSLNDEGNKGGKYIGTIMLHHGTLVFHLFEVTV